MKRPRNKTLLASLATTVAAALLTLAGGGVAQAAVAEAPAAAPTGWVRLGHLSPKTPPVDIYLAPFGQPEKVAFRKAAYGNVTPYSSLPPGAYTVSMRPADAPATSTPALSANVEVKAGVSYTALVFENGQDGTIKPTVLTDDLVAPSSGNGKVRVVQAVTGKAPMEVAAVGGPTLATGLNYGDTSQYVTIPEGRWTMAIKDGATTTDATLDVRSGSVNTVMVVNTPGSGLKLAPLRDSAGSTQAPTGGIDTGAGGSIPQPAVALLPALLVGALAGSATVLVLRRRSRA
ncbi:MAG: DUF4397 domain-containing protein [Pseudonocardia sp.]